MPFLFDRFVEHLPLTNEKENSSEKANPTMADPAAAPAAAPAAPRQCRLKNKCPHKDAPLFNCCDAQCDGWMHEGCSNLLLNKHSIPTADRPDPESRTEIDEPFVFCKKGCYTKWFSGRKKEAKALAAAEKKAAENSSRKKKVPWEEDGSLTILVDWLTVEGNYAEYCGATGNKGKTKAQHHKELAALIKQKLPESERTEKDVENKICHLERQFRIASDWANNTGQGVDNPGHFEEALLKRCPLYRELEEVMGDRPNAKPLATSDDKSDDDEDDVLADDDDDGSGIADTAALASMNRSNDNTTPPKRSPSASSTSSKKSTGTSSSKRRVTASRPSQKKQEADALSTYLGIDDGSMERFRSREVAARETEAKARMMEAEAVIERSKKEGHKVELEADLLSIQANATLLRERKRLLEEGISQEEIDELLPLRKK